MEPFTALTTLPVTEGTKIVNGALEHPATTRTNRKYSSTLRHLIWEPTVAAVTMSKYMMDRAMITSCLQDFAVIAFPRQFIPQTDISM